MNYNEECVKLNERAEKMLRKGKLKAAERLFTKIIKLYPNFMPAYWNRSGCYHFVGNRNLAVADLKKYCELVPDAKEKALALAFIGTFYLIGDDKKPDQAMEYFEKSIKLDPECHTAYANRGYAHMLKIDCSNEEKPIETKNFEAGIRDCAKAHELNPRDTRSIVNMSIALDSHWDDEGGINLCRKLLNDFPSSAPLCYFLGLGHAKKDETNLALEYLTKSIELNPNSFAAYNLRGTLYYDLGKYEEAIRDFTKAIELQPSLPFIYSNRSIVYCCIGNIDQAIVDLKKAFSLSNDGDYKDTLRKCLLILQDPEFDRDLCDSSGGKSVCFSSPLLLGQKEPFTVEIRLAGTLNYS